MSALTTPQPTNRVMASAVAPPRREQDGDDGQRHPALVGEDPAEQDPLDVAEAHRWSHVHGAQRSQITESSSGRSFIATSWSVSRRFSRATWYSAGVPT